MNKDQKDGKHWIEDEEKALIELNQIIQKLCDGKTMDCIRIMVSNSIGCDLVRAVNLTGQNPLLTIYIA